MAGTFDPYHKWLGIAADEQPANYYRLLGIRVFESDPDVIASAADQRMVHIRSFQSGQYSRLSQQLLNELSAARVCLLDPEKKADYDERLQGGATYPMPARSGADLEVPLPGPPPPMAVADFSPPVLPEVSEAPELPELADTTVSSRRSPAAGAYDRKTRAYIAAAVTAPACVLLVLIVLHLLNSEPDRPVSRVERPHAEHVVVPDPAPPRRPPDGAIVEREGDPESDGLEPEPTPRPSPAPEIHSDPEPELGPQPEPAPDEPEPERPPRSAVAKIRVPPTEDQQEVRRAIEELYPEPHDRDEALALGDKLAALAGETEKPTERFVLLRRASELASDGGDAQRMVELVVRIADEFEVDRLLAQAAMIDGFASKAIREEQIGALVEASGAVIEEALAAERFDLAHSLTESVYRACLPPAGREFRVGALARRREVQQLLDEWNKVQQAQESLKRASDDANAHATLGRWYALEKNDWERGLRHMAQGTDASLAALAASDLDAPDDTAAQIALADAWWDLAQPRDGSDKTMLLARAHYWYRTVQGRADSALINARVASRLAAIAPMEQPASAERAMDQPQSAVQYGRPLDLLKNINLQRQHVLGAWKYDQSGLTATCEYAKHAVLALAYAPSGSYELQVEFTRHEGRDDIYVFLPIGATACRLNLSALHGQVSGISRIDGPDSDDNGPSRRPGTVRNGHRYTMVVTILLRDESAGIDVTLDGEPYIRWTGKQGSISPPADWRLPDKKHVGIGIWNTRVTFHNVRVRTIVQLAR